MSENLFELAAAGSLSLVMQVLRTLDVPEQAERLQSDARDFKVKELLRGVRRRYNCALTSALLSWRAYSRLKVAACNVHKVKVLAARLLREKKAHDGQHLTRVPKIEIKGVKTSLTETPEARLGNGRVNSKIPLPKDLSEGQLKPPRPPMQEIKDQQRTPCKDTLAVSKDLRSKETPRRTPRSQDQENMQPRGRETTRRGRQSKGAETRGTSVQAKRSETMLAKASAGLTDKSKPKPKEPLKVDVGNIGAQLYRRAQEIEDKLQAKAVESEVAFPSRPSCKTDTWLSNRANINTTKPSLLRHLRRGVNGGCQEESMELAKVSQRSLQHPKWTEGDTDNTYDSCKFSFLDLTVDSGKESSRYAEQSLLDITLDV
jgi:hypothetical protein